MVGKEWEKGGNPAALALTGELLRVGECGYAQISIDTLVGAVRGDWVNKVEGRGRKWRSRKGYWRGEWVILNNSCRYFI